MFDNSGPPKSGYTGVYPVYPVSPPLQSHKEGTLILVTLLPPPLKNENPNGASFFFLL